MAMRQKPLWGVCLSLPSIRAIAMAVMAVSPHRVVEAASSDARLVDDACQKAAAELGLSKDELGEIVGRHRTSLERRGLEPRSKEGQLGLLFLPVARTWMH
jgi:hypothetical protein